MQIGNSFRTEKILSHSFITVFCNNFCITLFIIIRSSILVRYSHDYYDYLLVTLQKIEVFKSFNLMANVISTCTRGLCDPWFYTLHYLVIIVFHADFRLLNSIFRDSEFDFIFLPLFCFYTLQLCQTCDLETNEKAIFYLYLYYIRFYQSLTWDFIINCSLIITIMQLHLTYVIMW